MQLSTELEIPQAKRRVCECHRFNKSSDTLNYISKPITSEIAINVFFTTRIFNGKNFAILEILLSNREPLPICTFNNATHLWAISLRRHLYFYFYNPYKERRRHMIEPSSETSSFQACFNASQRQAVPTVKWKPRGNQWSATIHHPRVASINELCHIHEINLTSVR